MRDAKEGDRSHAYVDVATPAAGAGSRLRAAAGARDLLPEDQVRGVIRRETSCADRTGREFSVVLFRVKVSGERRRSTVGVDVPRWRGAARPRARDGRRGLVRRPAPVRRAARDARSPAPACSPPARATTSPAGSSARLATVYGYPRDPVVEVPRPRRSAHCARRTCRIGHVTATRRRRAKRPRTATRTATHGRPGHAHANGDGHGPGAACPRSRHAGAATRRSSATSSTASPRGGERRRPPASAASQSGARQARGRPPSRRPADGAIEEFFVQPMSWPKRTLDLVGAAVGLLLLSPVLARRGPGDQADQPRPGHLHAAAVRPRRAAVHDLQVPHDVRRRRAAEGRAPQAQRAGRPGVQADERPAHHPGRPPPPQDEHRRAAAALERDSRATCRSSARARCRSTSRTAASRGSAAA